MNDRVTHFHKLWAVRCNYVFKPNENHPTNSLGYDLNYRPLNIESSPFITPSTDAYLTFQVRIRTDNFHMKLRNSSPKTHFQIGFSPQYYDFSLYLHDYAQKIARHFLWESSRNAVRTHLLAFLIKLNLEDI